ncbi:MAG: SUMF1/EgtB/PvdO family nonheme iron enzyme [Planctomycetota bacterium]|nr:SUMF1/EgtB/PvdO family nonheme iron enzyme [Planctomycetota bacterium]
MRLPLLGSVAVLVTALAWSVQAQAKDNTAPDAAPAPNVAPPGFVHIPAGKVEPGCGMKNLQDRSNKGRNEAAWNAIMLELWGQPPAVTLPEFFIGKYTITNAQWKHYLDERFRLTIKTKRGDTLRKLAESHIRFRGEALAEEWAAIYVFNKQAVDKAVFAKPAAPKKPKDAPKKEGDEGCGCTEVDEGGCGEQGEAPAKPAAGATYKGAPLDDKQRNMLKQFPQGIWQGAQMVQPDIGMIELPAGVEITLYAARTPIHWYGWHQVSRRQANKEYCDIRKAPHEAFRVPEGMDRRALRLRYADFADCPVRYVSANEMLEFCEYYGVHLPSEYEWERAARDKRPRTHLHVSKGVWDSQNLEHRGWFAWADNPKSKKGPLPVDDDSVAAGDSPFGLRHMTGNVNQLTRTWLDYHPNVVPKLALGQGQQGVRGYALTAKGGAWGDGWIFMQISGRTGDLESDLSLEQNNRVAVLGFRAARHPQPGRDQLMHSIRRLAYNAKADNWRPPYPAAYALPRMAGADETFFRSTGSPYIHMQQRARCLAAAPLWFTEINQVSHKKALRAWEKGKGVSEHFAFGVLRMGVPFYAGVRLTAAEQQKLEAERKAWAKHQEKLAEEEKNKKKKRRPTRKKKKKKGEEEPAEEEQKPEPPPEQPPEPDEFEKLTEKNKEFYGLWRRKLLPPGEYLLVYWNGFIALANPARTMPPDAIFMTDPKEGVMRERKGSGSAALEIDKDGHTATFTIWAEEQPTPKKLQRAPNHVERSELIPLCETISPKWSGWPRRKAGTAAWRFKFTIHTEEGSLAKHDWKQ